MIFILQRSCCNCTKALALLTHPQQPLLRTPPPISSRSSARTAPQTEPGKDMGPRPSLPPRGLHTAPLAPLLCLPAQLSVHPAVAISPHSSGHQSIQQHPSLCPQHQELLQRQRGRGWEPCRLCGNRISSLVLSSEPQRHVKQTALHPLQQLPPEEKRL